MKKRILFIIIVLAAALSCSKMERYQGNALWCTATTEYASRTKGLEVFTDSLNTENNIFILDAWLELAGLPRVDPELAANPHYLADKKMVLSGDYWSCEGCNWTNNINTNFWATYPKVAAGRGELTWVGDTPVDVTVENQKKPSFDYDMTGYSGTRKDAVSATPDLLVSYAAGKWNEDTQEGGIVKFKFKHVLSGLRFKKGHIDSGYNITEIKIGGLHLEGTCDLGGGTNVDGDTLAVSWTCTDTPVGGVGLSQTISTTAVSEGDFITGDNMMFVIPQTMPSDSTTTISAVITKTSDSSSETREVALVGYSWKRGKIYDYTLSFFKDKNEFTVTVTEYNTSTGEWTN